MPLGQNDQIITGPWPAICPYDNDFCTNRHSLREKGIAKQIMNFPKRAKVWLD